MGKRKGSKRKHPRSHVFRFGVDQTPSWLNPFIEKKYVIPCSAKIFGPNNKKIHQKWLYIQNGKNQLASKGDLIILTKSGNLVVNAQNDHG